MNRRISLAALAALAATGCASYYYGDPVVGTDRRTAGDDGLPSPLLQANRAAVDKLLEMAALTPGAPVLVATLVNVDRLDESSRFGRACSEQIAGRLVQRGVPVVEVRMREQLSLQPAQGELLLSRELHSVGQSHQAQAVVVGTYAVSSKQAYISLKLVRPEGNMVVAAQDYAVPMTAEIRSLLLGL